MDKPNPEPSGTHELSLARAHERTVADQRLEDSYAEREHLRRWADAHGEDPAELAAEARGEA